MGLRNSTHKQNVLHINYKISLIFKYNSFVLTCTANLSYNLKSCQFIQLVDHLEKLDEMLVSNYT